MPKILSNIHTGSDKPSVILSVNCHCHGTNDKYLTALYTNTKVYITLNSPLFRLHYLKNG